MQIKQEISKRISRIIAHHNCSINKFALQLGYKRAQSVYDIVNAKALPSYEFFYRFAVSEYSEKINIRWLITGEGSMLTENDTSQSNDLEYYILKKVQQKDGLINYLQQKDETIIRLAEEIGRLKEQLNKKI